MKNLILTFILIILTICLVKQMNMKVFNQTDNFEGMQGCAIKNLVNPSPDEYYTCLMDQTNSIFKEMSQIKILDGAAQSTFMNKITTQIRNYFISLYINNLEKHYTGIIIIIPTGRMAGRVNEIYIHRAKPMHHFMKPKHENCSIYDLQPIGTIIESVSNLKIPNMGGIVVSMGYSLGISNPDNNKSGNKCSKWQERPDQPDSGNCIPLNLNNYNLYLNGGKFYNIDKLLAHYKKTSLTTRVMRRCSGCVWEEWEDTYKITRSTKTSTGLFNYHSDADGVNTCYLRGRASCHYAWGLPVFKHINIIPHVDFFNEFYAISAKRDEHRNNFKQGDFSKLDPYF